MRRKNGYGSPPPSTTKDPSGNPDGSVSLFIFGLRFIALSPVFAGASN